MKNGVVPAIIICALALFAACAKSGKVSPAVGEATIAGDPAAVSNLVSLDEALAGAVAEFGARLGGKNQIVVAGFDTPSSELSDFLADELSAHLAAGGAFTVLERGAALDKVNDEHAFQMEGAASDESAVGIGQYLGATAAVVGAFKQYAGFNQLKLRAIDVRSSQLITLYTARIRPDDAVLASILKPLDKGAPQNGAAKPQQAGAAESALGFLNMGKELLGAERYRDAVSAFDSALAIDNNSAEAYCLRGDARSGWDDYDLTAENRYGQKPIREDYAAALRIKPDYYEAVYKWGKNACSYTDNDCAIERFTAALKIKPDYHPALLDRGYRHRNAGLEMANDRHRKAAPADFAAAFKSAMDDFTAASKAMPGDHQAMLARGRLYADMGDYDRAIADFNAALKADPKSVETLVARGDAFTCRCLQKDSSLVREQGNAHYRNLLNSGKNSDLNKAAADWKAALALTVGPNTADPNIEGDYIRYRIAGRIECTTFNDKG
ncbi:MAG: tetratricopeptide repeat protein [Chitinispirillales bacterium]|jgi:tetratricopeptide (TPR) repeat protein|nr:tetratricopeptide repeat protein [Chitinispirillales bacterium]